jgi:hypothetical protein
MSNLTATIAKNVTSVTFTSPEGNQVTLKSRAKTVAEAHAEYGVVMLALTPAPAPEPQAVSIEELIASIDPKEVSKLKTFLIDHWDSRNHSQH